jgi:hypothetical protein
VGTFFLLAVDKVLVRAHRRYPCHMMAEQAQQAQAAQQTQAEPVERPERVPVDSGV